MARDFRETRPSIRRQVPISSPLESPAVLGTIWRQSLSGQLSVAQLADLKALGVTTIISLRRENARIVSAEKAEALRLGLKFLHFPAYGILGASRAFFERILEEMRDPANGIVYAHCQRGRGRSSLVVALHLVIDHAWDPELARQQAALDHGHQ